MPHYYERTRGRIGFLCDLFLTNHPVVPLSLLWDGYPIDRFGNQTICAVFKSLLNPPINFSDQFPFIGFSTQELLRTIESLVLEGAKRPE